MAVVALAAGCVLAAPSAFAGGARPPSKVGVGNVRGCVTGATDGLSVLRTYHASVLRLVVDPRHGENGQALPCVQAAAASGYKVHVSIAYTNSWATRTIVAYFRQVLGFYAPYAWAISIGNEQELIQRIGASTGARYAAVWRAVEPIVARMAPRAIRVAGEISPWGLTFLRSAYGSRLPGVQAFAAHAYISRLGFDVPKVLAWARTTHLPLWITEGLDGPGAWPNGAKGLHAIPLSRLRGIAVADAWLR
jgi:hypothetical protein